MNFNPFEYQKKAINYVINNKKCALFMDMGLGKTAIVLFSIFNLIQAKKVKKVLIIAPLYVAKYTWPDQIKKWKSLSTLTYSLVVGSIKNRQKEMSKDSDIFIVNRENLVWLIENYPFDFDLVVIDELSNFKNPSTKRWKALKKVIINADRVVGLTGTPAPNSLIDLWAQIYLIDGGQSLETSFNRFKKIYFKPGSRNGNIIFNWIPLSDAEQKIYDKISSFCLTMKKEDYLDLPPIIYQNVYIDLPKKIMNLYLELKKNSIITLDDSDIFGTSAAAICNKLLQFSNGHVYDENSKIEIIHDEKLNMLEQLIESSNSQPILVFYNYRSDKERIMERFDCREFKNVKDLEDWNMGKIPLFLCHPASVGYGINLQFGGNIIIWYGLTYSLEQYIQANNRLYRVGQEKPVMIYHLICKDTIDQHVIKVLQNKENLQTAMINYLKEKE